MTGASALVFAQEDANPPWVWWSDLYGRNPRLQMGTEMANEQDQARAALLAAIADMAAKASNVRAADMATHYAMAAKVFGEAYAGLVALPPRRRRTVTPGSTIPAARGPWVPASSSAATANDTTSVRPPADPPRLVVAANGSAFTGSESNGSESNGSRQNASGLQSS